MADIILANNDIAKPKSRKEILRLVNKALDYQFEGYSWYDMINDIQDLTEQERDWAKEHTGYKAHIC